MRLPLRVVLSLFAVLLFFLPVESMAQCNPAPCAFPMPSVNAMDACVLPSPSALDCYYGETTADPPVSFPPFWCTVIHNNHWFAFIADDVTATFELSCYGCAVGNGIQAAVLETTDCIDFTFVSPCIMNIPTGNSATLVATPLVPGNTYYLCIDGSAGAQCEYSINGTQPTVNGPAGNICVPSSPQATYTTSSTSIWSINPPWAGNIVGSTTGTSVNVIWETAGTAEVCAQGIDCPNAPLECLTVNVGEDTYETEFVDLCQGKTVTCAGQTFSAPGNFPVTLNAFSGCDSVVNCVVNLIPTVYTTEQVYMCQGQSATCAGQEFFSPGTFPVTLSADNGCDSIVNCKVTLIPTYVSPFTMVNLCGPAEYQICDNVLTASGIYTEICTNILGCDSIVNVNLAILEPQAVVAAPDTLDCDDNSVITLDGSGSPANAAVGGITLYQWTGPGIIGATNQPTAAVNQPGQYCLVVSHGRGGLYCSDTTCVTVEAVSAVPQLPQISGELDPCADSTILYTATAGGQPVPTSFVWTTPGNIPFVILSPDSIQITWSGPTTGGPLCVTANNSCGASVPACAPITVAQALLPPQFAGPETVCAGGGEYLFTLDSLQPGTMYSWNVPVGAVLSGGNDTIRVDFSNAASGQVCVTAENSCGAGAPVCLDVQVMPVPTADLAGASELCAGDSIPLTFSLTGNGPFDVLWSDGSQQYTLNGISNGHVVSVSPVQPATYSLLSVSDNSAPEACVAAVADSVVVAVWQPATVTPSVSICAGESYLVGGNFQTISGVYYDTLNTIHGCDSVIVTTLTVNPVDTVTFLQTTCDPALAGTNVEMLSQVNGCDSIVITTTMLLPTDTTEIQDTSCDPANVGVFTQNLSNVYGCDSTVITTVLYSESDTTQLTANTCDPSATGVFEVLLINSENCDSLVVTTVTLLPSDTTQLFGQDCNPGNVGTFVQDLTNQYGCDSTVLTTVSFIGIPATNLTATTCDPASVGIFSETLLTAAGCDSTVITTVTLLPSDTTQLFDQDCNPGNVGTFVQDLTNQYGCDSTVLTTVSFIGIPATNLTATTCDPASAGIFSETLLTAAGCDSTIITTVDLLPSDTTQLAGQSCDPANVGVFVQNLNNQYGCDSTVVTTVTLLPDNQVAIQSTTCDPAAAGVFTSVLTNQYGCDSVVTETVLLLPSDTTYLDAGTCEPTQVGTTAVVLSNQWGCDSTVVTVTSLLPPASCGMTASITGSTIPCGSNTGTLTLTATLGEPPFNYEVLLAGTPVATGVINAVGAPEPVGGLTAGNYSVIFTSANGFSATAQAVITQLFPPTVSAAAATAYSGFGISCAGASDGAALATVNGGLQPYSIAWSNGGATIQINNLAAGTFTVTVTDANTCTATAIVTLLEPEPLEVDLLARDPDCFGDRNGAIFVQPTGGVPPYRYARDNNAFQVAGAFTGLDAGMYTIEVQDANGCSAAESVQINTPPPFTVDLGPDIYIGLGESAVLDAQINVLPDSILTVTWTPAFDSAACPACLVQTVAPLLTTSYSIEVVTTTGCRDDDRILVVVDRRRHLYVPNIFSPDGDGQNDLLSVFAKPGTVLSINKFQVYDRWGEAVFTTTDMVPNDLNAGWDGQYRGQALNPGVFIWVLEVTFIDGVTETFSGDVTLYR